jgi:putative DNA primase/helicase
MARMHEGPPRDPCAASPNAVVDSGNDDDASYRFGDRSPSLRLGDGQTRLLVHCYAGCDRLAVLDELRRRGLLGDVSPKRKPGSAPAQDEADPLALWRAARDAHGTPVETYLASRHLILPRGADVLRFHPYCPFAGERTPAMIALVRNIESNEPQAIHRTALDLNGHKTEINGKSKMALAPIGGGAIKLTSDVEVTIALGVAEGIETALSLQRLPEWLGSPVWSLLNANGVQNFPVLTAVETLAIAVDHDRTGEKAARAVCERWRAAGREVFLAKPDNTDEDLNDVIAEGQS